ncbi:MAG TPA: hypothetical protein PLP29_16975 [Candidatus Ozemobacteraceae bacterium]|nr:hypothetical protein [Candidatus Ozemobacteraceae bacterium]
MKQTKRRLLGGTALIALLGLFLAAATGTAAASPINASIRSAAMAQAMAAKKTGGEACLSTLLNRNLPAVQVKGLRASGYEGVVGNISRIVGGRNYTAADLDLAEVPFYTVNGPGLSALLHDGGEWPGTGGDTAKDDGRASFGTEWAGEFYDLDKNGHYPKAVLRYIGSHCYIFVPPMFFPTLPRGISSTEDTTPAPDSAWGLYWPDTAGWGSDMLYFAPATGAKTLDPRFVFGNDKNSARSSLKAFADEFDSVIYPKMREYFGTEPDVDQDSKIFIILDDIRDGVGSFRGYFWAVNEFPRTQIPYSNEKELLHIDLFPTFLTEPKQAYRTTAHEFVHMIHFNEGTQVVNGTLQEEERWLEEGFTQYGQYVYDKSHTTNLDEFIKKPDTILVEPRTSVWLGSSPFANYGASYLFMFYLAEKYGGVNGPNFIRNLVRDKAAGVTSVNNALLGYGTTMENVFADFAIANFLDKTRKLDMSTLNDGKWGYNNDNDYDTTNNMGVNQTLPVKYSERVILSPAGTVRSSNVKPWAADYIGISGSSGNLNVGFDGDDSTLFKAAVIKRGEDIDPSVEYVYLNEKQAGNLIIQNYGVGNPYDNLVLVPMITAAGNYEPMNYVFSGTFSDLKVAVFPNPVYENNLHIIVRTSDKFASTPRLQMTYNAQQGYLTMTAISDNTYITNYTLKESGEGTVEAYGTNSNGQILTNTLKFSAVYYPAKSQGLLTASYGRVNVPSGALRKAGYLVVANSTEQHSYAGLTRITPMLDVALPGDATNAPVTVSLPLSGPWAETLPIGLFAASDKGPQWLGRADLVGSEASGLISRSGTIFAAADRVAPVIAGEAVADANGQVSIGIGDAGSGVDPDSIVVRCGSERVMARWDAASGKLVANLGGRLDGRYDLDVEVADRLGNVAKASVSADLAGVFGMSQAIVYPSPAKTFTVLRMSFRGGAAVAAQLQARIYDASGDDVWETPLVHKGGGVYEARWELRNRRGKPVSNGAYYVEFEAEANGETWTERRKMAVVR